MVLMQLGGFPFACSCSTQVCQKHRKHCLAFLEYTAFRGEHSDFLESIPTPTQQKSNKIHKPPTENLEKKQKTKAWFFSDFRGDWPPALRCSEAHSDTLSDTSPLRCLLEVAGSWINNEKQHHKSIPNPFHGVKMVNFQPKAPTNPLIHMHWCFSELSHGICEVNPWKISTAQPPGSLFSFVSSRRSLGIGE